MSDTQGHTSNFSSVEFYLLRSKKEEVVGLRFIPDPKGLAIKFCQDLPEALDKGRAEIGYRDGTLYVTEIGVRSPRVLPKRLADEHRQLVSDFLARTANEKFAVYPTLADKPGFDVVLKGRAVLTWVQL